MQGRSKFATDDRKDVIETAALNDENVQRFLEGKVVRKVIVVPKRLVNIVVSDA